MVNPSDGPSHGTRLIVRVVILLGLLGASFAYSQNQQLKFGRITKEDGLSNERIFAVAHDSTGFLWIGTVVGLDRFDGHRYRYYVNSPRDTTSLPSGSVTALLVARDGTVWAGTSDGGVAYYLSDRDCFERVTMVKARVNCLLEDSNGNLWVATRGEGLAYLALGASHRLRSRHPEDPIVFVHNPRDPASITHNEVNVLAEDTTGTIWVGTNGGLDYVKPGSQIFGHCPGISDQVTAFSIQNGETLWVGTSRGLLKADLEGKPLLRYVHKPGDVQTISDNEITTIHHGGLFLWVGTRNGLNRVDRESGAVTRCFHNPSSPTTLVNNFIWSVSEDQSGILWIATDSGINMLAPTSELFRYHLYGDDPPLPQYVTAVHVSNQDGTLWIGTWWHGVTAIRNGVSRTYTQDPKDPNSLSVDDIFTIFEDSRGLVWIGTDRGLDRFNVDKNDFERYSWHVKDDFCSIISIAEDSAGRLWLGTTLYGLILFEPSSKNWVRLSNDETAPSSLSNDRIRSVLSDHSGTMWVGTDGGGLNRYDPTTGSFVRYGQADKKRGASPGSTIRMLSQDDSSRIWIASANGLFWLDAAREQFHPVVLDSLKDVIPVQMICDARNRMWVSTYEHGIYLIDAGAGPLMHFGEADGLQGNDFSHAGCRTRDGELIFGGKNGYNIFDPESIVLESDPPEIVLTDLRVFDKSLEGSAAPWALTGINLAYYENYFSFEFSALDLVAPERVVYFYQLDGLDKDWIHARSGPVVSYQAVPPGEYTLRVKASNGFGVWSERGLSLPMIITPPFWQTAWFKLLVALIAVGTLVSIYNYLTYQIRRLEGIRQQIADDLHDDIGPRLSTIRGRIELFRKSMANDDKHQHLSVATQVAIQAADALRNVVWFLNPDHDRAGDIVSKMRGAAALLLAGTGHTFEEENKSSLPIMDMEFRRNLFLLYQESLNNIVKHSRATQVAIRLRVDDRAIELRISDNGAGFDPAEKKDGHGLGSLRHRAEQMHGVVVLESSPGSGTTVSFNAPLPRLPLVIRFKSVVMKRFVSRRSLSVRR